MGKTDIREFLDFEKGYFTICREERNMAAILYHLLLLEGNMVKFLKNDILKLSVNLPQEWSIYFEYAFLRDLWNRDELWGKEAKDRNNRKKEFILSSVNIEDVAKFERMGIKDFNTFFGCSSDTYIESPARWSLKKIDNSFHDEDKLHEDVCEFKYAFNAKPDIVIHLPHNKAICIEAKYESAEGIYKCGICKKLTKQTSIQKKIMELLGFESEFIYIHKKGKSSSVPDGYKKLSWEEAFQGLDYTGCPQFIREWIKRL